MKFRNRTVADPAAQQNFEQLQSWLRTQEYAVLGVVVTWPGATPLSNATVFAHGLLWTPRMVVPVLQGDAGSAQLTVHAYAITSTQFSVRANWGSFSPAAAASQTITCVAYR